MEADQSKKRLNIGVVFAWITITLFLAFFCIQPVGYFLQYAFNDFVAAFFVCYSSIAILGVTSILVSWYEGVSGKARKAPPYLMPIVFVIILFSIAMFFFMLMGVQG
jgi:hypothetical protein